MIAERCQYQLNSDKQYLRPVLAFADAVGSLLFSRKKKEIEVKSILIMQLGNFGDIIVTLPTIEGFEKAFPGAQIDVLMKKEMSSAIPLGNNVGIITTECDWMPANGELVWKEFSKFMKSELFKELKVKEYDLIVDVHGDPRNIWLAYRLGGKLRAGFGIRGLGFLLTHKAKFSTNMHIIDRYFETVKCFKDISLPKVDMDFRWKPGNDNTICIHPGTGLKIKEWTLEGWAKVADNFIEMGKEIILTYYSKDEFYTAEKIRDLMEYRNLCKIKQVYDYSDMAEILSKCRLFLSPDTGPAHLAHLIGTPQLTLFGPSMAKRWGYEGSYIEHPCECVNALECKYGFENRCMSKLDYEIVIKEAMRKLNAN